MQRFEDLGPLARMFPTGKRRIFDAGKDGMVIFFSLSTKVAARDFSQLLVRSLQNELLQTCDHVKKSITAMKDAVLHCEESVKSHTPEEKLTETEKVCLRLYNGDEVTRYMDALISNRVFQNLQSHRARKQLQEQLMMGQTRLRALPTSRESGAIHDILARSSHSTLKDYDASNQASPESGAFNRLLSVSILDKLEERYSGDNDRMRKELNEFLRKAGSLLPFNNAEHAKKGPGTEFSNENMKVNLIILMPDAKAEEGFAFQFKDALTKANPDGCKMEFIDTGSARRHEITILRFVQLFPVRYVKVLAKLKEEYEARLRDGNERIRKLEVHTEGSAKDYPTLFVPAVEEFVGPSLLLAMQLGVVRPKSSDGETKGWDGPLVMVDSNDIPQGDLGSGFDGAMMTCSNRNVLGNLQKFNAVAISTTAGNRERIQQISSELRKLAKTLSAGNDDRLRKLHHYVETAESEFLLTSL